MIFDDNEELEREMEKEFLELMEWERDYTLNEIPKDKEGNPLFTKDTEENFKEYLDWLADYLYEAEIKNVNLKEKTISRFLDYMTNGHKMLILASDAIEYDCAVEMCDSEIEEPGSRDLPDFHLNYLPKAKSEVEQKKLMGLSGDIGVKYADIAWRTPIAVLLQNENDKAKRIDLLKTFFDEYAYQSSK